MQYTALFLDFDGPVADVFAGYPAPEIARDLIEKVNSICPGFIQPSSCQDPMRVLEVAAQVLDQASTEEIDRQLIEAELQAVATAKVTPGAIDLIRISQGAGIRVGIVSNNSRPAIQRFLKGHMVEHLVEVVAGRPFGYPQLMKPDPYLLDEACAALEVRPTSVIFVGDSATDIEAGEAASVATVGYANKPGKQAKLERAGANHIVAAMRDVGKLLQQ